MGKKKSNLKLIGVGKLFKYELNAGTHYTLSDSEQKIII